MILKKIHINKEGFPVSVFPADMEILFFNKAFIETERIKLFNGRNGIRRKPFRESGSPVQ